MFCRTFSFCLALGCAVAANAQNIQYPGYLNSPAPTIPGSSVPQPRKAGTVVFTYIVNSIVEVPIMTANGQSKTQNLVQSKVVSSELEIDCDLSTIDLPGDGTRVAVKAVTSARHSKLLEALKEAKTEPEKEEAAKKLAENYRTHYAIETGWRSKSISELEKRIEEMRTQLKERENSEEKYVEAAITLAKLHAQGIAAEPPKLLGGPSLNQPYHALPSGSIRGNYQQLPIGILPVPNNYYQQLPIAVPKQ